MHQNSRNFHFQLAFGDKGCESGNPAHIFTWGDLVFGGEKHNGGVRDVGHVKTLRLAFKREGGAANDRCEECEGVDVSKLSVQLTFAQEGSGGHIRILEMSYLIIKNYEYNSTFILNDTHP